MSPLRWIEASNDDESALLALMETFYREEKLVFSETKARAAVKKLLARTELGQAFLLKDGAGEAHGHLVLTFGFSLEFQGRFVLLDEIFVSAPMRGRGYGKEAIELAARWTREHGVAALRLEMTRANEHARAVYLGRNFKDDGRDLLTRWV
ncbi:MAG: GNAT family N-acetyltransferase [Nibricoccus sp.]